MEKKAWSNHLLLPQCSSHLLIILISHLCHCSFHNFRMNHVYVSKLVLVLLGTLGQFKAVNVLSPQLVQGSFLQSERIAH